MTVEAQEAQPPAPSDRLLTTTSVVGFMTLMSRVTLRRRLLKPLPPPPSHHFVSTTSARVPDPPLPLFIHAM